MKFILLCYLLHPCYAIASEPPVSITGGCSQTTEVIIQVDGHPDLEIEVCNEDTGPLAHKYFILAKAFHEMMAKDEMDSGGLSFFLVSSRELEAKSMRVKSDYWANQFHILGNSLQVAIEVCQAEKELTEARKDKADHMATCHPEGK
jgi:hypothetical protein